MTTTALDPHSIAPQAVGPGSSESHHSFDAAAFSRHALSSPQALASVIDHTLLKPDAVREQVLKLAQEAAETIREIVLLDAVFHRAATDAQANGCGMG